MPPTGSLVGAEKLFEIIEDFRQITFIEPVRSILLHFGLAQNATPRPAA